MRTLAITFFIIGSILLTMSMHTNRSQQPKMAITALAIPTYQRPQLKLNTADNQSSARTLPLAKIIIAENSDNRARTIDAVATASKPKLTAADPITIQKTPLEESYCPTINETYASIAAQAGISEESLRQHNDASTNQGLALGKPIRLPLGSVPPADWTTPLNTANLAYDVQLASGAFGAYLGTDNRQKRVSLTFDIGYNPDNIELMEYLAAEGIQATFFMVGGHPEMVNHAIDNGHELGNHSVTHRDLTKLTTDLIEYEIKAPERFVQQGREGATTKPFFRAPFGATDERVIEIAHDEGYKIIGWTTDSGDWLHGITTEQIVHNVTTGVCPGAIVIMHGSRPYNRAALPEIIEFLRANNYEIVPLSVLMAEQG